MNEVEAKEKGLISRLTNETFRFPEKIREGYYSANYFLKTEKIIQTHLPGQIVTEQFFQREDDVMVCGIDECIALLHTFAKHPEDLKIEALHDGDMISSGEPVLKVTGRYEDFGYLESLIDGILARRSSVATNAHRTVLAAHGKPILNMADRQDDYLTQVGDGYACYVGGITRPCTEAMGEWWGAHGGGTMPHALIQMCGGDIIKAGELYLKTFPNEKLTALIDYHNNVVEDTLALARVLKENLAAVRVDTSKSLIDHYFDDKDTSGFDPHGVCKELIFALRNALDQEGFPWVKIIVSSGFTYQKMEEWAKENVPVDTYGVGSSLLQVHVGFTGDLVKLNGKDQAKEGRRDIPSSRLELVEYPIVRKK